MHLFALAIFGAIFLLVGIALTYVLSKLKSIEGTEALWLRSDPRCPSTWAICSCMWNLILLRHKGHLLSQVRDASATDPDHDATVFLSTVDEDCKLLIDELARCLFNPHLRLDTVERFLALQEYIEDFAGEM